MKFFFQKKKIIFIAILFFLLLLINVFSSWKEYRNYQDKMAIIQTFIEAEKSSGNFLDAAIGLLKSGIKINRIEELNDLGYTSDYADYFYKIMVQNIFAVLFISLLVFGLLTVAIFYYDYYHKKKSQSEIELICMMINELRTGFYRNIDIDALDSIGFSLKVEMESLATYMEILSEQAKLEKEGTKSLVTDISHQLKTPLSALKTCLEAWDPDSPLNEQEEFNKRCLIQLIRIEGLVSALVQISRMETGIVEIKKQDAVIFDTIVTAVNRIYPYVMEKVIEISLIAADELKSLLVPHDAKWLSEAIISVLENAVKYSPNNSEIILRMIKREVFMRIEIEDKGIGIPIDERNKVFKRFYRGSSDTVRKQNGSGVGLYLTREILSRHQGSIIIQTPPDKQGSLFIIQVPL